MTEPPAGARRITVPAERIGRWLDGFAERHGGADARPDARTVRLVGADGARAWLTVPFPPLTGSLPEHAVRDRTVGVLLARRGGYAAGVFDGPRLVDSLVGSSYVQGATKAGGWSQQRFARRREGQARASQDRAADLAARVLTGRPLEALVLGGDRRTVEAVLADPRLTGLTGLVTGPLLTVPDPRLAVLRATAAQFRAVTVRLDP